MLECQAEIYEYLGGEREEAPIEEYQACIERVNVEGALMRAEKMGVDLPVFNREHGRDLLRRISEHSQHVAQHMEQR